ncbi:unnamed protein product [Closterium sp. NIES-65]|nr:unnamed protein product [Closterium sp. NIES-65]
MSSRSGRALHLAVGCAPVCHVSARQWSRPRLPHPAVSPSPPSPIPSVSPSPPSSPHLLLQELLIVLPDSPRTPHPPSFLSLSPILTRSPSPHFSPTPFPSPPTPPSPPPPSFPLAHPLVRVLCAFNSCIYPISFIPSLPPSPPFPLFPPFPLPASLSSVRATVPCHPISDCEFSFDKEATTLHWYADSVFEAPQSLHPFSVSLSSVRATLPSHPIPDCEFSLDREASLHWYADFNETLSSCAIVAADSISLLSHPTPIPHLSSPTSSTPTPSASPPPSTPPASHSPPPSTPPAPPSPAPPPPPPLSCPHQDTSMSNRRPSRVPSLSRSSSSQTPLWAPLWDWMSAAGTSSSPRQGTTTASSTSHQQATATHTSPSTSPDSTSPSHPPQHCNGTSPLSPCHENAQGDAVSAGRRMGNRQQRGADRGKGRDKGKGKEKVELRSDSSVDSGDRGNAGQLEQQQGGCIVARLGFSRVVDITDSSQQPNRNERPAVGMPPPVPPRSLASMTRLLAASRGPPTSPTSSCFPTSSTRRQPFRPPPIRLTPNGLKERIAWTISAAVAASARHELLRRIARQLPELRQVAIADMQGQGSLSLGPEQLACLRRAEAENVSGEHSNAYSPRTPLPTLKMLLWHAPSLSVGDMELTGATLVILRNEALKVAKAGGELEGSLDSGTADSLHSSSQDQMGGLECRGEIAERRDAEQCLQSLLASSDPLLHASLELLQLSQTQRFEFSAF